MSGRSVLLRLGALLAALFLVFGACSSDGDGDGGDNAASSGASDDAGDSDGNGEQAAGSSDGCELVTAADAEAILLEPVTPAENEGVGGEAIADLGAISCNWQVDKEESFKLLQFTLWNDPIYYGGEAFAEEEGFEPVDGVGDEAFFIDALGPQLQVRSGDRVVILDVTGFNVQDVPMDRDTVKSQMIDLAKKVLAAL